MEIRSFIKVGIFKNSRHCKQKDKTKSSVRCLGRLDPRLRFLYQVQYSANKAQMMAGKLTKLMANIGGPLPERRRLLMEPSIFYYM